MVLGRLIKYNSSGITHGTGLASGINVQNVTHGQQYYKKVVQRAGKPVKNASAQTVMDANKVANAMTANAGFANDLVKVKLNQMDAGLEILKANVALDEGITQRETQYQQIMDKYGRNQLQARYQQGMIQSGNEGHHSAYVKASRFADL